ncbi:MAG: DNA-binding protein WhiA [Clostridiales bacterium]|nr:DNA-binding protein WhiA [Clostridiales bacterium]
MANFTEEIKNEIVSSPVSDRGSMLAMLSAFIRTSGSVILRDGNFGFEIITENEKTAEFFIDMLENSFGLSLIVSGAKFDLLSGKDKLAFECVDEKSDKLLYELGIVKQNKNGTFFDFTIDDKIISEVEYKIAFIKGAFLGGGSCTVPSSEGRTGYHFETVFTKKQTADGFCEILCDFEILAKLVSRKDCAVVYIKSKEVISDILNTISCVKCLEKLNKIVEIKDKLNNANRVNNCSVSNIDKTVTASVNQVRAIGIIAQTIGLQGLDKHLFEVAECRLADTNASMQELADRLNISKSCINHRMRKILELAQSLS